MSTFIEQIGVLEDRIKALSEADISHDELGTVNGFHEAQDTKQHICEYLQSILTWVYGENINNIIRDEKISNIESYIKAISTTSDQITTIVGDGTNNDSFPSQRQEQINEMKAHENNFKQQLHTYELDLKLAETISNLSTDELVQKRAEESKILLKGIDDTAKEANKILGIAQQQSAKAGVAKSASSFKDLKSQHNMYQYIWAVLFTISFVALMVIVWWIYELPIVKPIDEIVIVNLIKKILLLSVPIILLRVSLVKYNTERNLYIIYSHRQEVLNEYPNFEAGIGEDGGAKNQFRLDIAKYIFSDPKTGYTHSEGNTGTEVNINPAVAAVDKVSQIK